MMLASGKAVVEAWRAAQGCLLPQSAFSDSSRLREDLWPGSSRDRQITAGRPGKIDLECLSFLVGDAPSRPRVGGDRMTWLSV